jgi:Immunity protein Imm1
VADSPLRRHLVWGSDREAEIGTVDELDAIVDRLHSEAESQPFVVELVAENGATLSVGLGRPVTVVNYLAESGDPPYLQSLGEDATDELVFDYRGDWSEYPPESAVPVEVGRQALREFFATGRPPKTLTWQEV